MSSSLKKVDPPSLYDVPWVCGRGRGGWLLLLMKDIWWWLMVVTFCMNDETKESLVVLLVDKQ